MMAKIKKETLKRLEKLVEHQAKIGDLLEKIGDDAYNANVRIGARRDSASMIISEYMREAAINKTYFQALHKNFKDEYEQD